MENLGSDAPGKRREPAAEDGPEHLEAAVDDLRRRVDALERTVSSLDRELRDLLEAEDIGPTR